MPGMRQRTVILLGVLILALEIGILSLFILDDGSPRIGVLALGLIAPLNVSLVLTLTWYVSRNAEALQIHKASWIFAFFAISVISLPLFWVKHLWPHRVPR